MATIHCGLVTRIDLNGFHTQRFFLFLIVSIIHLPVIFVLFILVITVAKLMGLNVIHNQADVVHLFGVSILVDDFQLVLVRHAKA